MNKKRIVSLVLAAGVVLGGSNFAYAADNTENQAVVEAGETETKSAYISDEEAVDIAKKAMNYYLNKDGDSYVVDEIYRCEREGNTIPTTINIIFNRLGNEENKYEDNTVILNAETGEVLRVARGSRKGKFEGEVNKEKIKESIINVLAKAGLKPYENTNWDRIFVAHDGGDAHMYLYTEDKKAVIVTIDLEDFSVVNFYKAYVMYPGESFGIED